MDVESRHSHAHPEITGNFNNQYHVQDNLTGFPSDNSLEVPIYDSSNSFHFTESKVNDTNFDSNNS